MTTELKPCPFCKDGENNIRENHHNPTMSGGITEPVSVDITHWCKGDGLPRRRIIITGRTRQEAIEAWNTRPPEAVKHVEDLGANTTQIPNGTYEINGDTVKVSHTLTIEPIDPEAIKADAVEVVTMEEIKTLIEDAEQWNQSPCHWREVIALIQVKFPHGLRIVKVGG